MKTVYFKQFMGEVIALFPDEIVDHQDNIGSYQHIGQHSAASPALLSLPDANYNVYQNLLIELVSNGYNDLNIMTEQTLEAWRMPTPGELAFGNGALHYATFNLGSWVNPKTGKLKHWIKSPFDSLRYNRT